MGIIKKLDWCIDKFASSLLVVSLLSILLFSSMAIILRWFHINLYWVDPFVRHTVFFGTFLGGVVATGRGSHIGIDLISKFLELKHKDHARIYVHRVIMLSSGLILVWMMKSGIDFTRVEMEFSKEEFWGIHSGYLVAIIPFGLFLMMLRFFLLFILSFDKNAPELPSTGEML